MKTIDEIYTSLDGDQKSMIKFVSFEEFMHTFIKNYAEFRRNHPEFCGHIIKDRAHSLSKQMCRDIITRIDPKFWTHKPKSREVILLDDLSFTWLQHQVDIDWFLKYSCIKSRKATNPNIYIPRRNTWKNGVIVIVPFMTLESRKRLESFYKSQKNNIISLDTFSLIELPDQSEKPTLCSHKLVDNISQPFTWVSKVTWMTVMEVERLSKVNHKPLLIEHFDQNFRYYFDLYTKNIANS